LYTVSIEPSPVHLLGLGVHGDLAIGPLREFVLGELRGLVAPVFEVGVVFDALPAFDLLVSGVARRLGRVHPERSDVVLGAVVQLHVDGVTVDVVRDCRVVPRTGFQFRVSRGRCVHADCESCTGSQQFEEFPSLHGMDRISVSFHKKSTIYI
jgi:hypothetical protein